MPATIFNGNAVKHLKNTSLLFNDAARISGTLNPTVTPVSALPSSVYQNITTGLAFIKQDSGLTTNWLPIVFGVSGFYPTVLVTTDITFAVNTINLVNTTGTRTLTLPASPVSSSRILIKDTSLNANVNNITIVRAASEFIEGVAGNFIMNMKGQCIQLVSDASLNWWVI